MNLLKRILNFLLKLVLGLLTFIIVYIGAVVLFAFIPVNTDFTEAEDGVEIYVISNGVHSDVCVPVHSEHFDWETLVSPGQFKQPNNFNRYIAFGWGDRGFYLETPNWADLSAKVFIRAAFWPSSTAMHVTYYTRTPVEGKRVKKVRITTEQYEVLIAEIKSGFEFSDQGEPILIDCCRYPNVNDNFYEATGSFSMFKVCNSWTNQVLKRVGIRAPAWAISDKAIFHQLNEVTR